MNDVPSVTSQLVNISFGQILPALKILLEAALHRGELATFELADARDYVFALTLIGLTAFALTLLGGFTVIFTLAALVWERSDRAVIFGIVGLGFLVGAGVLFWIVTARLKKWDPFKTTNEQLRNDQSCLLGILTAPQNRNGHANTKIYKG